MTCIIICYGILFGILYAFLSKYSIKRNAQHDFEGLRFVKRDEFENEFHWHAF